MPTLVLTSDTDEVLIGTAGVNEINSIGNPSLQVGVIPGVPHALRRSAPVEFNSLVPDFIAD